MTTTHPYPTATLDRLRLRADAHAERAQARRSRRTPPNPVGLAIRINRAEREVMHWESQVQERDGDAARLLTDPLYGPDSSRTQRAIASMRYARAELEKARAALAALTGA